MLSPYINLAERMGLFQTQLCEGGLTQVTVEYSGEVSNLKLEPITLAALKGLLTPILNETVNYVNAPLIAKDRGIEIKFIGLRPGEKLFEELMLDDEQILPTYHEKIKIFQASDAKTVSKAEWINELTRLLAQRQEGALIAHLSQIVPEYQPSESLASLARSFAVVAGA
jgi:FlaA1/EpsC-like NDP-sugar epimerase